MQYTDVIKAMESEPAMPEKIPSLGPTQKALEDLQFYESSLGKNILSHPDKVIVVTGTNGKGSTCAALEALFLAAGESVGLYTSPHLIDYTERIRWNGQDISHEDFVQAYETVKEKTKQLSHFETLTMMAVVHFMKQKKVDRLIFEVGIGGLWDASNAIPHGVAVLTTIGLDHKQFLGNTLCEVAENKLGIVPSNGKIFHFPFPPDINPIVKDVQTRKQGTWLACEPFPHILNTKHLEPQWVLLTPWGSAPLNMPGLRAVQNISLALRVVENLTSHMENHFQALLSSLESIRWPGRMEKFMIDGKSIYLSGDHNPEGVQSLLEILKNYKYKRVLALVGIGQDKDISGILDPLLQLDKLSLYLTKTPFKGGPIELYGKYLNQSKFAHENGLTVLQQALQDADAEDMILVTGSLYLVGQIRQYLLSR